MEILSSCSFFLSFFCFNLFVFFLPLILSAFLQLIRSVLGGGVSYSTVSV
uniref:Uncharacterized protein n=1 Tax=Arundo donax TaxID=35708 RepID=A0A0A9B0Q3_ARUDO